MCPDPAPLHLGQSRDGHKVVIEFEGGYGPRVKVIHPESGCTPAGSCGLCGRSFGDPEGKPCSDCMDYKPTGCWLDGWEDEALEYMDGKVTLPLNATWDFDHPLFEVGEARD